MKWDVCFSGPLPKARMSWPSPFPEMEENREVKAVPKLWKRIVKYRLLRSIYRSLPAVARYRRNISTLSEIVLLCLHNFSDINVYILDCSYDVILLHYGFVTMDFSLLAQAMLKHQS